MHPQCSPMVWETGVQPYVESYQRLKKWYLMLLCLTRSIIRYGSRVKWSNTGDGEVPFPTPWCSSYWKGSLRVTLDYSKAQCVKWLWFNGTSLNFKFLVVRKIKRIRWNLLKKSLCINFEKHFKMFFFFFLFSKCKKKKKMLIWSFNFRNISRLKL